MFFRRLNLKEWAAGHKKALVSAGLVAILLLALGLRLVNISAEPFWGDEVLSLDIATTATDLHDLVGYIGAVEFHPPLYYLMLRPWAAAFGATEAPVRALSVIFSLGTVLLGYWAGRRMFKSSAVGLVAAGLLAVLPMQIEYGQEGRPYSMVCFAGTLAMIALWEIASKSANETARRRRAWLGTYILASAAGLYLNYSYFFVFGAMSAWWLLVIVASPERRTARAFIEWLVAHAAVFLLFYPWLVFLLYKIDLGRWEIYGLRRVANLYQKPIFLDKVTQQLLWLTKDRLVMPIELVAQGAAKLLVFLAAAFAIGRAWNQDRPRNWSANPSIYLGFLASLVVAAFIVSPLSIEYTTIVARHILFVTVPLALLLAAAFTSLPPKLSAAFILVFLATLITPVSSILGNDQQVDYDFNLQAISEEVNRQYRPGDIVLTYFPTLRSDYNHYLRPELEIYHLYPQTYFGDDLWRTRHRLGLLENEFQVRSRDIVLTDVNGRLDRIAAATGAQRVWVAGMPATDHFVHSWFEKNGWRQGFRSIGSVFLLDSYERPKELAPQP